jgi:hypothetical protein
MWCEVRSMDPLYYIENVGCDATTYGIARISDEDFPKFKAIIENLNKNSYYGCMPKIDVYKINESDIQEITEEDDWVFKDYIFHLDGKKYTFADGVFWSTVINEREKVI